MKKHSPIFLAILSLILLFSLDNLSSAGDKIRIHLQQPPPNQLGVKDLWKLDITNLTKENIRIYLTGTATESKKGLVVSGKSKTFSTTPGTKTYTYEDFKSGEVDWKDKSVQESILRTGNVPEGDYTICVTALYENGDVADQESCIDQSVKQQGQITLISPEDAAEIDPEIPLVFAWTPLQGASSYELTIVEILSGQSPDDAMRKNSGHATEKLDLRTTTYQYGLADTKLETGKKYAWSVRVGDSQSDVWTFSVGGVAIVIDSLKVTCSDRSGFYCFKIWVHNGSNSTMAVNVNPISITGTTPPTSPTLGTVTLTPTNPIAIGGACLISGCFNTAPASPIISSVSFFVPISDPNNQYNQASYNPSATVPCYHGNCCDGFLKTVDNVDVVKDNSNNVNFTANITAGPLHIKKVTAGMVYFYDRWNDANCIKCVNDSKLMGNFTGGTLGGFAPGSLNAPPFTATYSREITFSPAIGVDMTTAQALTLNLSLPPATGLTCCADTIRLCIRFSFTDTNCVMCDTIICRKIVRTSTEFTPSAGGNKMQGDENVIILNSINNLRKDSENSGIRNETQKINVSKEIQVDPCYSSSLNILTGWDYNLNQVYNEQSQFDGYWNYVDCTSDNFISSAYTVPPYWTSSCLGWSYPYPSLFFCPRSQTYEDVRPRQSQWISPFPTAAYTPSDSFCLEFKFCMIDTTGAKLDLYVLADDAADVYLNGHYIQSVVGFQNAIEVIWSNSTIPMTGYFVPNGVNKLRFKLKNTGGGAMGLDVWGTVTTYGNNVGLGNCCESTGMIEGYKWIDRNHDNIFEYGEGLPGWTFTLNPGSITVTTDQFGYFYFPNLAPGTYSVSEQLQSGYTYGNPANGNYSSIQVSAGGTVQLVFRNDTLIGPTGNNCCDNFTKNITSTTLVSAGLQGSPNIYSFQSTVTTGPNRIKKVRAFMTNFSQTYSNADCQQCVNNPTQWGSIIGLSTGGPGGWWAIGALTPSWTDPYNTTLPYTNIRETIWENAGGGTAPPLSNQDITFLIYLPDRPILCCCADTINFCIKYEFTDTTCKTCDTTLCYQYVLTCPRNPKYPIGKIRLTPEEIKMLPKVFKDEIEKNGKSPQGEGERGYDENFNANSGGTGQIMLYIRTEDNAIFELCKH